MKKHRSMIRRLCAVAAPLAAVALVSAEQPAAASSNYPPDHDYCPPSDTVFSGPFELIRDTRFVYNATLTVAYRGYLRDLYPDDEVNIYIWLNGQDAFLEEIRKAQKFFFNAVIGMAQRIEHDGDRVIFTFGPHHKALKAQLEGRRPWLEELASRLAGRRMAIIAADGAATAPAKGGTTGGPVVSEKQAELRQQALEDSGVQAMLDVFAAEIKDVEER